MEKFLVINAGSSSLKFQVYDMPKQIVKMSGYFEKIGQNDSFYTLKFNEKKEKKIVFIPNHEEAVKILINELFINNIVTDLNQIKGVGHRVVHGGAKYSSSVIIDEDVIKTIKKLEPLANLHIPANLTGIKNMMIAIPSATHVAVFDTAFHQTLPYKKYLYPVPKKWYQEYSVRKYGFHGTSHKYITQEMKKELGKEDVNLIICHIGSGVSVSEIKEGICRDTSMGMTPLDGLVMGTRSGSIDPSIIDYMTKVTDMDVAEVIDVLNKKSGFFGIAGKSDCRDLEDMAEKGNEDAITALEMFKTAVIKYIAQYYFDLDGKVDAIVFTAGIGENGIKMRERIVEKLSRTLPIALDKDKNNNVASYLDIQKDIITTNDSAIPIWVMPTNEEKMILEDTFNLVKQIEKNKVLMKKRNYI